MLTFMLRSFLSDIYFLVSSKVEFLLHKKNSGFSFTSTIQVTPMLTLV